MRHQEALLSQDPAILRLESKGMCIASLRQEAIENIRTIAQEASLPCERRKLGAVKAALAYLPSLFGTSTDIFNYLQVYIEGIKRFFGV